MQLRSQDRCKVERLAAKQDQSFTAELCLCMQAGTTQAGTTETGWLHRATRQLSAGPVNISATYKGSWSKSSSLQGPPHFLAKDEGNVILQLRSAAGSGTGGVHNLQVRLSCITAAATCDKSTEKSVQQPKGISPELRLERPDAAITEDSRYWAACSS